MLHFNQVPGAWLMFDRPGMYEIDGQLPAIEGLQPHSLRSEPASIEIVEPSDSEKAAFAALRSERIDDPANAENAAFIQGVPSDKPPVLRFVEMLRKHPKGIYSAYAQWALGNHYLRKQRFGDCISILQDLLKQSPNFPLRAEVEYRIYSSYRRKALAEFHALAAQEPDWVGSKQIERTLRGESDP
jgi:hypothetical protein